MPRIYTSANDPLDFCRDCYPSLENAELKYGDLGDGPDERGDCFEYDADHPPYSGEHYICDGGCGKILTDDDNDRAEKREFPIYHNAQGNEHAEF